jgi:hypothetical protein
VDSGRLIEMGMAVFAGSSFSMLFLSIVLSLEIVFRTTRYMYERARVHNTTLVGLVVNMREVMKDLEQMRKLASLHDPKEIDEAFNTHYRSMQKFMAWREDINDHMFRGQGMDSSVIREKIAQDSNMTKLRNALLRWNSAAGLGTPFSASGRGRSRNAAEGRLAGRGGGGGGGGGGGLHREKSEFLDVPADNADGGTHSFSDFWDKHCAMVATIALFSFYFGTCLLLLDIAVFMYAKFKFTYNNSFAGMIIAAAVFGSLFVGLLILLLMRCSNRLIFRAMTSKKTDGDNVQRHPLLRRETSTGTEGGDIEMGRFSSRHGLGGSDPAGEVQGDDDNSGSGSSGRRNRMINGMGIE